MNFLNKYFLFFLILFFKINLIQAETRVLLKFKKGRSESTKQNLYFKTLVNDAKKYKYIKGLEAIDFKTKTEAKRALETYKNDPNIQYAEMDQVVRTLETIPNDSSFSEQWGLHNTGQSSGATDIDINAPQAWDITTGGEEVVIGIIDTGIDYAHSDLTENLWINPNEIASNGIDDDSNGYIDDIYGINVITSTGDPLDDNGHGTHVAGIIAAKGNNSSGISGVMQTAKIISCKFLNDDGIGSISGAINCLEYLLNINASLIATNNSWGGGDFSQALYDAIEAHLNEGILFFAAAGNHTINNDAENSYPSNYQLPNVISVAAVDRNGALADFSNYGRYSVHVGAPGVSILSTYRNGTFENLNGTSMSTPFVTGLAGLIKAHNSSANWIHVKNRIISSGKTIDNLNHTTITGKLVRAYDDNHAGALNCDDQNFTQHVFPKYSMNSIEIGSSLTLSAININCELSLGDLNAVINDNDYLVLSDNGTGEDQVANDGIAQTQWTPSTIGAYEIAFNQDDTLNVFVYDSANWQTYGNVSNPLFSYRDITENGTALTTGDEIISLLESPIALAFAGGGSANYHLYVSSNGTISLTDSLLTNYLNLSLPQSSWVSIIAPYWDDLTTIDGNEDSGIFYAVTGEEPNRELVIEWRNMRHYALTNSDLTFEVIFFENNASILFNYLDTDLGNSSYNNGGSATIGIQTKSNLYKLFSYNTKTVTSNYSLLFQPGTSSFDDIVNPNNSNDSNNNEGGSSNGGGGGGGGGGGSVGIDISLPDNHTPNALKLIWPSDNAVISMTTLTLILKAATDPDNDTLAYDIEIHKIDQDAQELTYKETIASLSQNNVQIKVESLEDQTSYIWRARSFDGQNYSEWVESNFHVRLNNVDSASDSTDCNSTGNKPSIGLMLLTLMIFLRLSKRFTSVED